MDLSNITAALRAEIARLQQALAILEGTAKRRGRPPKALTDALATPTKKRTMSDATRKKMAAAQQKRWAAKRKAEAKG